MAEQCTSVKGVLGRRPQFDRDYRCTLTAGHDGEHVADAVRWTTTRPIDIVAELTSRVERAETERDETRRQFETLTADLVDEADWIDKRGGMISAAWVANGMRHLARYGYRRPRAGEPTQIHYAPAPDPR